MTFLLFFGGIVLLILIFNLRGRVYRLEQIMRGQVKPQAPIPPGPVAAEVSKPTPLVEPSAVHGIFADKKDDSVDQFVNWLKEDWLLKLGALLLLIGFGWLTTYAFLNNWIGPMGRIALGIIAGALFLILGWWRIQKFLHQGGVFLVLGSTTILLTIFAAREIYDFFNPLSALVVMFLSTAFVAAASIKYDNRALGLASLILAGIAPILTNSPTNNYVGLFAYLLVVIIGAIWITVLTGRRELTTAALILVTFYSIPHLFLFTSADRGSLLLFAYAFAALFFLTNTAGIVKMKDQDIVPDVVTAGGNGLFLLAWIMVAGQREWQSLIIAAWMTVFVTGAFMIFKITQKREPFYVYAGVAVAMLAAATAAELKGAALTIAYTVESAIISLLTYFITKDVKVASRTNLLFIGPVILSLSSLDSRAWLTGFLHDDFFVLFILALAMIGLGLYQREDETADKGAKQINSGLLVLGSLYAYALLWLSLQAELSNNNHAVIISLFIYTVIGLIAYFNGLTHGRKGLRLYGGVLVGFVVLRLLFVDVWTMEIAGKITTFFLIGTLLISTAFLGKKNRTPKS